MWNIVTPEASALSAGFKRKEPARKMALAGYCSGKSVSSGTSELQSEMPGSELSTWSFAGGSVEKSASDRHVIRQETS